MRTGVQDAVVVTVEVGTHAEIDVAVALDQFEQPLGMTTDRRHLHRGDNVDANRALHLLAIGGLSSDTRTNPRLRRSAHRREQVQSRDRPMHQIAWQRTPQGSHQP